ncbi:MAG: lipoyl protein ligase domain-containing protein [Chlamydiota bacterium]
MWEIIDSGRQPAQTNMDLDAKLLTSLSPKSPPILHLYDWESPSLTYGHFSKPHKMLKAEGLKKYGLSTARRPTGGGVIFHLADLAFSILVPSDNPYFSITPLQNYAFVNNIVIEAIALTTGLQGHLQEDDDTPHRPTYCMIAPTKYDVIMEGKKVAGAAQRNTKAGFLHQGSISITMPPEELLIETVGFEVAKAMKKHTYQLSDDPKKLDEIRQALKRALEYLILNY